MNYSISIPVLPLVFPSSVNSISVKPVAQAGNPASFLNFPPSISTVILNPLIFQNIQGLILQMH